MLGIVNFAPEESNPRAILLRVVDQREGIISCAGAAAKHSDHEVRIVLRQFLHRARAMIDDLEKQRTARLRHAGQAAKDVVVGKLAQLLRRDAAVDIRIEYFQKITEL